MKLGILVGTRPEIIKMSPVLRRLQEIKSVQVVLIHSNQHYSKSMDAIFFEELGLQAPNYNLEVGGNPKANQIGNIMIKLEPVLQKEKIDALLVQGDTNTVAAGALVASKMGVKIGHVEAGLRSYDKSMPEEGNRIITDHLSDYLFAVTEKQVQILKSEGVDNKLIHKVGNTIVDAVVQNLKIAKTKSTILKTLGLQEKEYVLFSAHRAGNVDTPTALKEVLRLIELIPHAVCWPLHPRTRKNLEGFGYELPKNVVECEPLGYFDFLMLEENSKYIVTDSGGLQEEACILGVPCITIRENTERPETVDIGANILVGRNPEKFKAALSKSWPSWKNPFGEGNTSELIIDEILRDFGYSPVGKVEPRAEKIVVVGMGYMGIPTAGLLATSGFHVTGVDIDTAKVERLNRGEIPFEEEGMAELIEKARSEDCFVATTSPVPGDIFLVAVPTPHIDGKCDLKYVISAVESLKSVLKDGDTIIIESTIKPGTCTKILAPIVASMGVKVDITHCPERAIPGNTLYELIHNDRIIGGDCLHAVERVKSIYSTFVKGEIFTTSLINAECAKLMENTFRDVNIALANEFSMIAQEIGFDAKEAISLANRHPRVNILSPGPGVGGHCIPIDPWFLTEDTRKAHLIRTARNVNDAKPEWCVQNFVESKGIRPGAKVALLGVAYKPNVDDAREAPAEYILKSFTKLGIEVRCHDPFVRKWDHELYDFSNLKDWADHFVIVTEHNVFTRAPYKDLSEITRFS